MENTFEGNFCRSSYNGFGNRFCNSSQGYVSSPPGIQLFQAAAISIALCFVVIFSSLVGALAPLIIHKMGYDPTVMSGPLMATVIDIFGLTIYFESARILLNL